MNDVAPVPLVEAADVEEKEVCHLYDDIGWPLAICGFDLSETSHECPNDLACGCVLCAVCEAVDVLGQPTPGY